MGEAVRAALRVTGGTLRVAIPTGELPLAGEVGKTATVTGPRPAREVRAKMAVLAVPGTAGGSAFGLIAAERGELGSKNQCGAALGRAAIASAEFRNLRDGFNL